MATQQPLGTRDYVNRAVEVFIHVGLVVLLSATCFLILRPFLPLMAWGIIVAIAVYTSYHRLQVALGGREVLSAVRSPLSFWLS